MGLPLPLTMCLLAQGSSYMLLLLPSMVQSALGSRYRSYLLLSILVDVINRH